VAAPALVVAVVVAVAGALGPPPPAGTGDGDVVEIDGVLYQRKGDQLYTLDDEAVAGAVKDLTVTGSRLD
jgi:hypothetical protein